MNSKLRGQSSSGFVAIEASKTYFGNSLGHPPVNRYVHANKPARPVFKNTPTRMLSNMHPSKFASMPVGTPVQVVRQLRVPKTPRIDVTATYNIVIEGTTFNIKYDPYVNSWVTNTFTKLVTVFEPDEEIV